MVIVFNTKKAEEALVPAKGAAVKLSAAEVKALGGAKGMIPLAVCRFTGGSANEILAAAKPFAKAAGVKENAVSSFFRFNTAALRKRTVPYGTAAVTLFTAVPSL